MKKCVIPWSTWANIQRLRIHSVWERRARSSSGETCRGIARRSRVDWQSTGQTHIRFEGMFFSATVARLFSFSSKIAFGGYNAATVGIATVIFFISTMCVCFVGLLPTYSSYTLFLFMFVRVWVFEIMWMSYPFCRSCDVPGQMQEMSVWFWMLSIW